MDNSKDKAKRNTNSAGESRQPLSDPIVRKDCDVNEHKEEMQTTKVRRVKAVPVPATSSSLFSDAPIGAGRPAQTAPSITELLLSILRFKWTILAVFALVAAPAIAAIWTQVIPQYRARGEVRIQPIIPYLVFRTEDSGMIPLYASFVNTQVSIMRNSTVLQRVLDQPEVQNTQWYKNTRRPLKQRLLGNQAASNMERLRDTLSVGPRRGTEITDVSFMDPSAKDAKIIVDAVLDQYTKYVGEKSDETADKLYRQLIDQHNTLKSDIDGRQKILADLRKSLETANPQELIAARRMRLDDMQVRLTELRDRITLMKLKLEINQANAADSNEVPVAATGVESQPDYYADAEWRGLNDSVRAARHQIDTSPLKSKHPGWDRMAEELAYAEESLRLREMQLDRQWRDRAENRVNLSATIIPGVNVDASAEGVTSLEQQLLLAEEEEQRRRTEFDKQEKEFQGLFVTAESFEKESAALQERREVFNAVRQRKEQKEMERNVPGSISILSRAAAPSLPYNDRRIVFTAMVLVMGLGMGGGVAFLKAGRNQTIYDPRDLPPTLQAPFLGYIPLTRIKRPLGKSLHDEIQRIRDYKIESVRLVRTALLSRLNGQGGATILIASATAGTGKSTFTMMLGKSLAQSGKKVIMVDADLRRMTLSKRFGLAGEPGFMESLRSKSVDRRQIFSTETSGLSILSAGRPNGDGSVFEETANGAFKACIAQLRRHFDIILLDSSPILAVADATILSGQVDGTILVERELVSQRPSVIDALARLDSAGGRLMGTVFVGSSESGSYGYGYGYGYSKTRYS